MAGRDAGRYRLSVGFGVPAGPADITSLSAKWYEMLIIF
jgi:hypothetical protein